VSDPALLTATQLLEAYRQRALSPVEVIAACYARLDRFNPAINAFVETDRATAMVAARASEARWMNGEPVGRLDGVPTTIKDSVPEQGKPYRRGSTLFPPDPYPEEGAAVARLKEEGAILIGRTTLPEVGWIGHCNSPLTGITRNPWNLQRTTGGSSGGAVAACALGIGALHIGTDGAGSIRIPAAFTGVFGHKATFGRVASYPFSAFAIVSHVGPITRSVADAALMLSVIAKPDIRDIYATRDPAPDYRIGLAEGVRGLRIAWSPKLGYVKTLDPEVARLTADAARRFAALGAIVEEVDPEIGGDPTDLCETIWAACASVAFRDRTAEEKGRLDPGLQPVVMMGERVTAADYIAAANARGRLSMGMHVFHQRYDLLLTPTMPIPAFEAGQDLPSGWAHGSGPMRWLSWSPYTYPFNLTRQPAASVPCGFTASGLPVGLQIVGPLDRDDLVLRAAHAFESIAPFAMPQAPRG
jgi:aspartyl-tRNA(Asn)/glutamyl-tRNA(Gln) amidotransferase subunit A